MSLGNIIKFVAKEKLKICSYDFKQPAHMNIFW